MAHKRDPIGTSVHTSRHCKMRMYIAVAKNGNFEIVEESKESLDPKQC